MIYQMHQYHGRHIAYTSQEATANREAGWEDVTEEQYYAGIVDDSKNVPRETLESDNEEIPRNVLVDLYVAKFGEKPHNRMKDSTIKAKLEEE